MTTWLTDANGNRCSVEYWGSKKAATAALKSLKNCRNCTNCSGCSDCSRCSYCSDCSYCSRCSDCSGCSDCRNIAWRIGKENLVAEESATGAHKGPPPIPAIPDIHQAIYAAASHPGSLAMEDVHICATTHCRGGWAVTLAGEAGAALEAFYNWELAAMLIYDASDPIFKINPARFYDSNEDALADMKRMAELAADQ